MPFCWFCHEVGLVISNPEALREYEALIFLYADHWYISSTAETFSSKNPANNDRKMLTLTQQLGHEIKCPLDT